MRLEQKNRKKGSAGIQKKTDRHQAVFFCCFNSTRRTQQQKTPRQAVPRHLLYPPTKYTTVAGGGDLGEWVGSLEKKLTQHIKNGFF